MYGLEQYIGLLHIGLRSRPNVLLTPREIHLHPRVRATLVPVVILTMYIVNHLVLKMEREGCLESQLGERTRGQWQHFHHSLDQTP